MTKSRDKRAALNFMKKVLNRHRTPVSPVTDDLKPYQAVLRDLGAANKQEIGRHANNTVEIRVRIRLTAPCPLISPA